MSINIIICTKDQPYDGHELAANEKVRHPNATEVGEQKDGYPGGDIVDYECPHCKTRWTEELAQ